MFRAKCKNDIPCTILGRSAAEKGVSVKFASSIVILRDALGLPRLSCLPHGRIRLVGLELLLFLVNLEECLV